MIRSVWLAALSVAWMVAASGTAIAPVFAQQQVEPAKTLMPGKGSELTTARCVICHDATHITRTKLSRAEWEDNLKVMITRGMPIEPHEIPIVIDYLSTYYNRDVPAPTGDAAPASAVATDQPAEDPVQKLLTTNACMACHAVDRRLVGPGFREIAERYRSDGQAAAKLMRKIREGGAGAWGATPMPPHPQLGTGDLERMAAWIIRQK